MAVKLNSVAFEHARKLVEDEYFVWDERDAWSDDQPSSQEENEFLEKHGFREYAKWHLGVDEEQPEDTKKRYEFPYGDFFDVHRCGVLAIESRAGQYKHEEIERAAARLREMMDEKKPASERGNTAAG